MTTTPGTGTSTDMVPNDARTQARRLRTLCDDADARLSTLNTIATLCDDPHLLSGARRRLIDIDERANVLARLLNDAADYIEIADSGGFPGGHEFTIFDFVNTSVDQLDRLARTDPVSSADIDRWITHASPDDVAAHAETIAGSTDPADVLATLGPGTFAAAYWNILDRGTKNSLAEHHPYLVTFNVVQHGGTIDPRQKELLDDGVEFTEFELTTWTNVEAQLSARVITVEVSADVSVMVELRSDGSALLSVVDGVGAAVGVTGDTTHVAAGAFVGLRGEQTTIYRVDSEQAAQSAVQELIDAANRMDDAGPMAARLGDAYIDVGSRSSGLLAPAGAVLSWFGVDDHLEEAGDPLGQAVDNVGGDVVSTESAAGLQLQAEIEGELDIGAGEAEGAASAEFYALPYVLDEQGDGFTGLKLGGEVNASGEIEASDAVSSTASRSVAFELDYQRPDQDTQPDTVTITLVAEGGHGTGVELVDLGVRGVDLDADITAEATARITVEAEIELTDDNRHLFADAGNELLSGNLPTEQLGEIYQNAEVNVTTQVGTTTELTSSIDAQVAGGSIESGESQMVTTSSHTKPAGNDGYYNNMDAANILDRAGS